MDAQKIGVKLYLERSEVAPREFVPVLHRWIQEKRLDELMIDVADYGHVHRGPGIALICDAANYYVDEGEGRLGLMYVRKREGAGDFGERLAEAVRRALVAARLLEEEPALGGRAVFRGGEMAIRIHDRLRAPNTAETFAAVRPEIERLAARLYGGGAQIVHLADSKELFGVRVTADPAARVEGLLGRIGG